MQSGNGLYRVEKHMAFPELEFDLVQEARASLKVNARG